MALTAERRPSSGTETHPPAPRQYPQQRPTPMAAALLRLAALSPLLAAAQDACGAE